MKAVIVLPMLVVGAALLAALLDRLPFARRLSLAMITLSFGVMVQVHLNFIPSYRGMSRGFDVGTIDMIVLALVIFSGVRARRYGYALLAPSPPISVTPVVLLPPGLLSFLSFVGIAALSLTVAPQPIFAWMDLSKLLRGTLLFWVTANLVRDDRLADSVPAFLMLFVGVEAAVCARQYFQGLWWIPGTFEHKNSFALALNMVLPAILLEGLLGRRRTMPLYLLVYGVGAICLVLSRSRMAWITFAVAAAIGVLFSIGTALGARNRAQVRAQLLALLALAMLALPALLVLSDGIASRLEEDRAASLSFREINNGIALKLANESPLGVGLNSYVVQLEGQAGDALLDIDRTVVHHAYLLVAAELGWVGLGIFLFLMLTMWRIGLGTLWLDQRGPPSRVAMGLILGLGTAQLHSFMEADILRRHTFFIFCALSGILVAVHMRQGGRGWRLFRARHSPAPITRGNTSPEHRRARPLALPGGPAEPRLQDVEVIQGKD